MNQTKLKIKNPDINRNPSKKSKIGASCCLLLLVVFLVLNYNPKVSATNVADPLKQQTENESTTIPDKTIEQPTSPSTTPSPSTDGPTDPPVTQPSTTNKPVEPANDGSPYILIGENAIISGNTGEKINLKLPLINLGTSDAVSLTAMPSLSNKDDQFPFEIEQSEYIRTLSKKLSPVKQLNQIKESTALLDFGNFTIRENLNSGYYRVTFKINYRSASNNIYEQIERFFFIKVTNPQQAGDDLPDPELDPTNNFDPDYYSDYGYNPGLDDGLSGENKSVPRLLCTGFTTNPERVFGGTEFDVKLKLKNTSKTLAVKNIKLTLTSMGETEAIFMPVNGASTIFIENIEKNSEQEVEVKLKSNATIEQKAYPLNLAFEYEDKAGNPFTADEVISIMVFQELRFDLGKMQIMPQSIEVGNEANVMFSVFNKGKATLYNLAIILPQDSPLEDNEIFIGNLESGNSKDVDFMVKALQENLNEPIPFQITFEDAEGKITIVDHEMDLIINQTMQNEFEDPYGPGIDEFPEAEGEIIEEGMPWWSWLVIGLGSVILIGLLVKLVKKQKSKKEQAEIDEMV